MHFFICGIGQIKYELIFISIILLVNFSLEVYLDRLAELIEGELHHGILMRSLYATDASVYRELPLGVALPENESDVRLIVSFAGKHKIPLIPRAAGTSLAGQCVGNGLVVDLSKYMNKILEINAEESWVRVQPGVVRDELNLALEPFGLYFGPNTSTSNRCNIGGMVGNNSCGTTSIVYGSTRDHVLELRTILSNGDPAVFRSHSSEDLKQITTDQHGFESGLYEHIQELLSRPGMKELIRENYPRPGVSRRNTGYALDALIKMQPFGTNGSDFNLCSLLCGSEGTLAITTEIKLNLVPLPDPCDIVLAAHFKSIDKALRSAVLAMAFYPTACELMDKTILDCTRDNISQQKNRFFVSGDPEAILMIEFRANDPETARGKAQKLIDRLKAEGLGYAFPVVSGQDTPKVWALRNAGLGVLANIPGDKKAVACIEDTAVRIQDLPDYIRDFSKMMAGFKQKAVYYAHAGAGELHLRPVLDLKKSEDVTLFREISEASAKLVSSYKGSLSGEHGDGRVRAEFIPLVMGEEIYKLFEEIKDHWDPEGILNPGKIVRANPMDTDLRYVTDRQEPEIPTRFDFQDTGGILPEEPCVRVTGQPLMKRIAPGDGRISYGNS